MPDTVSLAALHFLRPAWLLVLLPFFLLVLLQWRLRDAGRGWRSVLAPHLLPSLIVPGNQRSIFSPFGVSVLLMPLLAVTLAGPSWRRADTPFAEDKAPLVIAIDLSASMASDDLRPNRLQRARDKILTLVAERGDAYTALIAYAGTAHSVLPLSNDQDILLHYLDAVEVGMLPRPGKSPATTVPLARALLDGAGGGGTLLIVGDGGDDVETSAFSALRDSDTQLLVWGIGKTQRELDADAQRGLLSAAPPLQETQLRAIAAAGGGHYRRVTVDGADVAELQRRLRRHYDAAGDSARPWVDSGYLLLPAIMLCFLLWFRRGWVLRW